MLTEVAERACRELRGCTGRILGAMDPQATSRVVRVLCAALAMALVGSCKTSLGPPRSTNADDFLIVDCLRPGRVQVLGQNMTYLSRRQPARVSARQCRIEGGEYTDPGAPALGIWLPQAEQGDAAAQTYVGEIYEKGLGIPPDYGAAALWYRKAAEQGSAPAAINLGSLYARGLGVPKDPQQALVWYARAAGQTDGVALVIPPSELLDEIDSLKRELAAKETELQRTRRELDELRSRFERQSGAVDSERRAIEKLRRELAAEASVQRAGDARARELQRRLADREEKLAADDRELAGLRASLAAAPGSGGSAAGADRRAGAEVRADRAADRAREARLAMTRGVSVAQVPSGARHVVVSGRAGSASGISSVSVNDRAVKTADRRFRVELPASDANVRIVAMDRNRRSAAVEFQARPRPRRRRDRLPAVARASRRSGPTTRW